MTKNFEKITIWVEVILFFVLISTVIYFGVQRVSKDVKFQSFISTQKINSLSKKLTEADKSKKFTLYLFSGDGCSHCTDEKNFLQKIKSKYPGMKVQEYEVFNNKENYNLLTKVMNEKNIKFEGVPVTFINDKYFVGYDDRQGLKIEEAILEALTDSYKDTIGPIIGTQTSSDNQSWVLKKQQDSTSKKKVSDSFLVGNIDVSKISLPLATLVIAFVDSFNPCSFFILFSLLGLLLHTKSRKKMLLIGGIFVLFSWLIYFLFMAAWLNLFLFTGHISAVTLLAGIAAFIVAVINIKDFIWFKQGVSLTINDEAKNRLFDRMRSLLRTTSTAAIIFGTIILAISANLYELLCTAGFPMIFTKMLTMNNLSNFQYYLYLALYNLVYVIPLAVIVIVFVIGFSKRNISEWQGRVLKLVSGTMMLGLGTVLIVKPSILNNLFVSLMIVLGSLAISLLTAVIVRKR